MVVVAGDVNSTLACALAASKLGIPVVHLEAGLRSGDWTMPEEINRVLTDRLSDLLLTHSPEAKDNLAREGIDVGRVRFVGNTMIDSLRRLEGAARERAVWRRHDVEPREYMLVTLHRPSNVDDPARLAGIVNGLCTLAAEAPVLFPVHPRTRARLAAGTRSAAREGRGALRGSRRLPRLPLARVRRGNDRHRLRRACRRRRPRWASRVTRCARTPSARSRSAAAPTSCSATTPSVWATVTVSRRPPTPCVIPLWDGHAAERAADAILTAFPEVVESSTAALA